MNKAGDFKEIMEEFAPLLKEASKEQRDMIKGILLGAKTAEKAREEKAG